jgi:hypothetical protein
LRRPETGQWIDKEEAKDGGTLEYVFKTDEQDVPNTVTEKKVAEIAADFMTSYFY